MIEALILVTAFHRLNRMARQRGRRGPWWGVAGIFGYLVAGATLGSWLAGELVRVSVRNADVRRPMGYTEEVPARSILPGLTDLAADSVVGLSGLVGIAVVAGLLGTRSFLPRRNLGEPPRAQTPYWLLTWLLYGLAVLPYLLAFGAGASQAGDTAIALVNAAPSLCAIGLVLIDAGRYCSYLAWRNDLPSADQVLARDPRPPVVFLRAFGVDELRVRVGSTLMTLEQRIGPGVFRYVGPFVAAGNPADYVPAGGAAKLYRHEESWQQYMEALVRRAACVLVAEGTTAGLRWELAMLRQTLPPERVFFLKLPEAFRGAYTSTWEEFRLALQEAGFVPPSESPTPGTLFVCDPQWRLVPVESAYSEIGAVLAERLGWQPLSGEVDDRWLRTLIERQGSPAPFASSFWRYFAAAFIGRLAIALITLGGMSGRSGPG